MQFVPCRLGSFRKFLPIPRTIAASHSNFRYAPGMQLVEKFHCAAQPTILRSYFKPILSVKQFTSIDAEHAVSYEELKALIEARDVLLIDVRDPEEIEAQGRIIGAVNVPLGQLPEAFEMTEESFFKKYNFEKPHMYDANVVFHGLSHIKSTAAVEIAHKHGFTKQNSTFSGRLGRMDSPGKIRSVRSLTLNDVVSQLQRNETTTLPRASLLFVFYIAIAVALLAGWE